jgi:hypothetical protein
MRAKNKQNSTFNPEGKEILGRPKVRWSDIMNHI